MPQCEICGKEVSQRGLGPHRASHRPGGIRGDKETPSPSPEREDLPLFDDLPPRSRAENEKIPGPPGSPPSPVGPSRAVRYETGIGVIGAGLSIALKFDDWENEHWRAQGKISARIFAQYVEMYPEARESKIIDSFFGGPEWLILLEAVAALAGPILGHRGLVPWPGVERGTYDNPRKRRMSPQMATVVTEAPAQEPSEDDDVIPFGDGQDFGQDAYPGEDFGDAAVNY